MIEGQFTDVAPGATLEVRTAYLLQDTTSPVEATFEQFFGKKSGKITIDPTTLSREDAASTETMATDPDAGTLNRHDRPRPATRCSTGGTANGTAGGR